MDDLTFLRVCVKELGNIYQSLSFTGSVKPPIWEESIGQFRHVERDERLFLFLKGIRSVSLLNAALALFDAGHAQEMGIIWRCLDETHEDMALFAGGTDEGTSGAARSRVLNEFFQEQFQNPDAPILGSNKRDRVPRRRVRAVIAAFPENVVNPHDHSSVLTTVDEAFSGYVHGAYPHIMELCGGLPARFHLEGMTGTPRMVEQVGQILNYVYRTTLLVPLVAARMSANDTIAQALGLRHRIEERFPDLMGDPAEAIRTMKANAKGQPKA